MIIGYDFQGDPIAYPNFIELQWNRLWNGFGDFVLYMPASEYDSRIKYIQNIGRPETGIVQKIVYEQKPQGDFVTLSGYFIEWLLNFGMLFQDKSYSATTAAGVRTRIRHFVRDCLTFTVPPTVSSYTDPPIRSARPQLYTFSLDASMPTPDSMNFAYAKGTPCGEALLGWLNMNGYSMTATPVWDVDPTNNPTIGLQLVTYTGEDKSDQVIFGKEFDNVSSVEYALDDSGTIAEYLAVQEVSSAQASGYTNVVTLSTSQGTKRYLRLSTTRSQPQNMGNTWPFRIMYTNVNGDTSISQTDLYAQMRSEAQVDMLNHRRLETISVDVIQNHFKYLEDYDLGDTCGITITALKRRFSAQIVEVHEVQSANKLDVQIVLGTPKRQNWRRR